MTAAWLVGNLARSPQHTLAGGSQSFPSPCRPHSLIPVLFLPGFNGQRQFISGWHVAPGMVAQQGHAQVHIPSSHADAQCGAAFPPPATAPPGELPPHQGMQKDVPAPALVPDALHQQCVMCMSSLSPVPPLAALKPPARPSPRPPRTKGHFMRKRR